MKKLSFFLMAMLMSVMGFAAEYTIVFKSAGSDSNTDLGATPTVSSVVSEGTSYVASFSGCAKIYVGVKGTKLGSSKATGTLNFNLATLCQENVKSIKVVSAKYGSDTGTLTLAVNGTNVKTGITPGTDYTHTYNAPTKVESIKLNTSSKRAYLTKVIITTEEEVDPNAVYYTITTAVNDATMGKAEGGGEYKENTKISLTATPNSGYEFVKWSNESTANPLEVTVTENATYTAIFQEQTPITIAEANKLADAATCVLKEFTVTYIYKSYIHIQDASGYGMIYKSNFGLNVGDVVTGFTCSKSTYNGLPQFVPTCAKADLTIVAGEAPAVVELTTAPTGNYHQVVKLMNLTMTGSFNTNSNTTVKATCPDGTTIDIFNGKNHTYTFVAGKTYNITGDVCQYSGKIQVSTYAIEEYVAPVINHTITVSANPAEGGVVTGGDEYEEGATATLTATANEGYEFVNWTENEEEVSTDAEYTFAVLADRALVANFKAVEPDTITWELNGGEFPAVVVPTNAELWGTDTADVNGFMHYYNHYYGLKRATQTIENVASFAYAQMQQIMTDEASAYKWLGDYVQSVATAAGKPLSTDMAAANESGWRWSVWAFFNACAGKNGSVGIDFTEAGKPEAWGAAYQAAHAVVLPTEPVDAPYTLPTPVKEGYTFVGWYDNAAGADDAYTVIPAGWSGTLYAIWEVEGPGTALENIAVEGKAVKAIINGQLIIIKNGVQYNAQGQVVK